MIPYCTMLSKYGQFTCKFKNIEEANLIFFSRRNYYNAEKVQIA